MKKIILLAPNGQVGFELKRSLQPIGEVITLSRAEIDFINVKEVVAYIDNVSPDIVVNASAYTAVDKAETEKDTAFTINRDLPKALAGICLKHDAWLIHYSTDYVYPGNGEQAWLESDKTEPLSVYGQSKLEGDLAIQSISKKYLIFRTSWVYAARGSNFMLTMLRLAKEREALNVVNDQVGAPTPARLIADITANCLCRVLLTKNVDELSGVYHLAPRGETTWYGFAAEIFKIARANNVSLALDDDKFQGISTEEYPTPASRPKNSRLNLTKIQEKFGVYMPDWQTQLKLTFDEL